MRAFQRAQITSTRPFRTQQMASKDDELNFESIALSALKAGGFFGTYIFDGCVVEHRKRSELD